MPASEVLVTAPARRTALLAGSIGALTTLVAAGVAGYLLREREVAGLLGILAGSSGVLAGILVPTWLIDAARARVAEDHERLEKPAAAAPGVGVLSDAGVDNAELLAASERRLRFLSGFPQGLIALVLGASGLIPWYLAQPAVPGDITGEFALGIAALVLAFPLLVASHRCHSVRPARFPEAPALARALRLMTWTLVIGGSTALTRPFGFAWTVWGQWAIAALIIPTAAEQILRACAAPFLPVARSEEARGLGDSAFLALFTTRGEGGGLAAGLKERFGIDLSQSWALRFLRRAAAPLGALLLLICWLLTGLTALGTGERGVYERLGAVHEVLPPGLHAHLPWPFGVVHRLEYGQIHELPLAPDGFKELPEITAEADTPADFDRLWDKAHPADASYLVPAVSLAAGQVAHQLITSDVRICWRVGLSDAAARQALYALETPEDQVRRQAGRLLAHAYAERSLGQLIGENRDRLAGLIKDGMAKVLDGTGIEVTAVIIDAIHPPLGAVPAYHGVQAAEIITRTETAKTRAIAAIAIADAQREAYAQVAAATGAKDEQIAKAKAEATLFKADGDAYHVAPEAYALEKRLQAQGRALSKTQITVIDHRLPVADGTTVDLRSAAAPRE